MLEIVSSMRSLPRLLEIEKKRAEEIDSKMNVNINLETGEVKIKMNEEDTVFEFGN